MTRRETPLVLVADDEEDIRALVAFRLQRAGYEVITAADGAEALTLATTRLPDLVVLDMMMPKATGLEVTRSLRGQDETKDIPVILLTARAQEADVARGFEAGVDDYVKKPFSPQDLLVARSGAARARVSGEHFLSRLGSADGAVAVAEAAHGLDRTLGSSIRSQLLAQIAHVELHLVLRDTVRIAPGELEQLLAAEDLVRMLDEGAQQPELERRQPQVYPARLGRNAEQTPR